MRKKERGRTNFDRIKFSSSPFASKMSVNYKSVALKELIVLVCHIINML